MASKKNCTEVARQALLKYLKSLYEQDPSGEKISAADKERISQKKNLVRAVYDLNKGKIVETGLSAEKEPGTISISPATINKAIDLLMGDKIIEKKLGRYWYAPPKEELYRQFPILTVANSIEVTPLEIQDFQIYKTDRQYTPIVASYINSRFDADDIRAVCIENLILCLDFRLPGSAKSVAKSSSLYNRMEDILATFAWKEPIHFDDSNGLTEQEIAALEEKALQKKHAREMKTAKKYGGKLSPQHTPKRNIKKKGKKDE